MDPTAPQTPTSQEPISTSIPNTPIAQESNQPTPPAPVDQMESSPVKQFPVDTPPPPQKGNGLITFLVIILILTGLGALGYWAYQNYFVSETPEETVSPTPEATTDPTTDWEIHTSPTGTYSFKYPNGLKLDTEAAGSGFESIRVMYLGPSQTVSGRIETNLVDGYSFTVTNIGTSSVKDPKKEIEKQAAISEENCTDISEVSTITVDQKSGYQHSANCLGNYTLIYISDGTNTYSITLYYTNESYKEIIFSILSTFKFIDLTKEPVVTTPTKDSKVTSPLTISGTVPAGWMFEGSFPIKLVDSERNLIAQGSGKEVVSGSWMKDEPVKFSVDLPFSTTSSSGFLILAKDNPSGNKALDQTFEVSVKF